MKYINIFNYFNYRVFLKDYYTVRKKQDKKFSYRYFALKSGYNSSGYYPNVVNGINNLTKNYLPKFCRGLDLNIKESDYFQLMVDYTHAVSNIEKQNLFEKMLPFLPSDIQRLKNNQKEFYSKWIHVAVHQALEVIDFKDDYTELANFINPSQKVVQIKHSITLLQQLELIAKDKNGYWRPSAKGLIGGEEVGKLVINDFQNEMMDLAKEAVYRFDKEDRHIFTNTFSLSMNNKQLLKKKIEGLQKEISKIGAQSQNEEQLLQFNLQLFPLSIKKPELRKP